VSGFLGRRSAPREGDRRTITGGIVCGMNGRDRRDMNTQLRTVFVANGELQAQQILNFLEAAGIDAVQRGEALRNTHGLTVDGLGAVEIMVADADADEARALLDSADAGLFRLADDADPSSDL
jgi:hypothetical protein